MIDRTDTRMEVIAGWGWYSEEQAPVAGVQAWLTPEGDEVLVTEISASMNGDASPFIRTSRGPVVRMIRQVSRSVALVDRHGVYFPTDVHRGLGGSPRTLREAVARTLDDVLERLGLTQSAAAVAIGTSERQLRRVITAGPASFAMIEQIADGLGVELHVIARRAK